MKCFLESLWLAVWRWQHTKVCMFLVYKGFFFWRVLYCHVLEIIANVVKRGRVILHVQFVEWLNDLFIDIFFLVMLVLFFLIFLFLKINCSYILLFLFYVCFFRIILLGIKVFLDIDNLILDRIHFYLKPFIGITFILDNITVSIRVL